MADEQTKAIRPYVQVTMGVAYGDGENPTHSIYEYGPQGPELDPRFTASAGIYLRFNPRDPIKGGLIAEAAVRQQSNTSGRMGDFMPRAGLFVESASLLASLRGGPTFGSRGRNGFDGETTFGYKLGNSVLLLAGLGLSNRELVFDVESYTVSPEADPATQKDAAETEVTMNWHATSLNLGLAYCF